MTMEQENALIRRALLEAAALDFAALRGETPPLSSRQKKRLRVMLADPFGYARRFRRPVWKKALHTAAMIAVTAALSISLLSAASPAVRAAIKAWFMEIRHSDIVYYFMGETNDNKLPNYTISDLPEGYTYAEEKEEDGFRRIWYENGEGQRIRLEYAPMVDGSAFWISTKNMLVRDITVNGCPGQVFLSLDADEGSAILWMDEKASLQFFINAFTDESGLLNMADSVSLYKTEKP